MQNNPFLFWLKNARCVALPQSMLPAWVAICLAYSSPDFSWILAILAVLGVAFGHLGINLWDDYFDYKKDHQAIRNRLKNSGIRSRTAKCNYLISNEASLRQLFFAASFCCFAALSIGIIIFAQRGAFILIISGVTALLGFCYSAPPFRFSYHGLGELIIGLVFGPLLMSGVYYAACGNLSPQLLFLSIPIGLLVANIVYTHSAIDFEADKALNKKTLAILLRQKNAVIFVSFLLNVLPFLLIGLGIFLKIISIYYAFVFVIFFGAIYLFWIIWQFQNGQREKIRPKWWMGPMENWQKIEAEGIDWFMIRWYLARNLLVFFCLIIVIASLL